MEIRLPRMLEAAVLKTIGYEEVDDEEEDEETELEDENIIGVKITPKLLKDVEDDWVQSYLIN